MSNAGALPCGEVLARLWEYLDEELGPDQARAVRAHLDACGHCHPRYRFDRAYLRCLERTAGEMNVRPEVRSRILDLLARDEGGEDAGVEAPGGA